MLNHPSCKILALYLVVALLALSFPAQGWAMLLPAEREAVRGADLAKVRTVLESGILKQRLMDYGLTAEETLASINSLSDEQIHQLAANMESIQAGGDILGDVIVILLIVLIVILILQLSGHRVVVRK